jgi:TatD DNase family protein
MTSSLVDTHAHLDDPALWNQLEAVLDRATQAGVGRILAVGSDVATSRRAVDAAGRYPIVYAAVGIHPHNAARFQDEREEIEALLDADKVVAVGEIGLDYFRGLSPRSAQVEAFEVQLRWARRQEIPAVVHNREADDDVLRLIQAAGAGVVMHAFSATRETARRALDLGASISFAGNVTFPKAGSLRELARDVPEDRLLAETDAPVLAPQARRGRTNEPAYVAFTLECLAHERRVDPAALAAAIRSNANRLFHWDCP